MITKETPKKSTKLRNQLIKLATTKLTNGQWSCRAFLECYGTFSTRKCNFDEAIEGTLKIVLFISLICEEKVQLHRKKLCFEINYSDSIIIDVTI